MASSGYSDEVKDAARLLKQEGLSNRKIADQLGVGRRTVDAWLADAPVAPGPSGNGAAADSVVGTPPPAPSDTKRQSRAPQPPTGARRAPAAPPPDDQLNLRAVSGYIEGAYKLAGKVALERGDAVLSTTIDAHAEPAAQAWTRWIESEPRVQELLRKMMVGTPAGEVIAIHVSLVFSYVVARTAAERIAADAALAAEQAAAAAA